MANLSALFSSGGIKSIQSGTISVTGSSASGSRYAGSNTATINSVSTSKSFVILRGVDNTAISNTVYSVVPSVKLTNATTVTATIEGSGSGNPALNGDVHYTVVEFN